MSRTTIILHDDEIRGLLDCTRTQLRRPVGGRLRGDSIFLGGWADSYVLDPGNREWMLEDSPFGAPGARLAVRGAYALNVPGCSRGISYRADHRDPLGDGPAHPMKWRSAATMPRWACRYALEVGEVRCQRLQDATEDDAKAEGVTLPDPDAEPDHGSFPCHMCGGTMLHAALGHNYGVYERDCDTCDTLVKRLGLRWDHRFGKRYPLDSNPWTFTATGRLVAL